MPLAASGDNGCSCRWPIGQMLSLTYQSPDPNWPVHANRDPLTLKTATQPTHMGCVALNWVALVVQLCTHLVRQIWPEAKYFQLFSKIEARCPWLQFWQWFSCEKLSRKLGVQKATNFYQRGIQALQARLRKCTDTSGDYVEKWQSLFEIQLLANPPFYELFTQPSYTHLS